MKGHRFNLALIAAILVGLAIVGSTAPRCDTSSPAHADTKDCGQ